MNDSLLSSALKLLKNFVSAPWNGNQETESVKKDYSLHYRVTSDENWDKELKTLNDLYEEIYGSRPFERYMGVASYFYHDIKLQNYYFRLIRMEKNIGIVQNLEGNKDGQDKN